ncbi:MAG: hypothetical protein J3K34DRAFT_434413 [Monoraphidium minutum]|nr:MAG: hypothetical protein J3K34DRAFT_434413 [Monoraphidium minutum]
MPRGGGGEPAGRAAAPAPRPPDRAATGAPAAPTGCGPRSLPHAGDIICWFNKQCALALCPPRVQTGFRSLHAGSHPPFTGNPCSRPDRTPLIGPPLRQPLYQTPIRLAHCCLPIAFSGPPPRRSTPPNTWQAGGCTSPADAAGPACERVGGCRATCVAPASLTITVCCQGQHPSCTCAPQLVRQAHFFLPRRAPLHMPPVAGSAQARRAPPTSKKNRHRVVSRPALRLGPE